MKKLLGIVVLGLLLNFNAYAAPDGKGQIQLSENVVKNFLDYIVGDIGTQKSLFNKPGTFWITIDGSGSYWWYNPHGAGNVINDHSAERAKCERHYSQSCSRFARGRYVRWDNGINPKGKAAKFSSKMSESEVRAKLIKLGFYDKDSIITSNTDETNTETSSNKSLTDQLSDLSKLFEDGLITAEEFTKAKKKLLN